MRQQILDLFHGKKIGCQPAFSGLIHVTAEGLQSEGLVFPEVHKDARKMSKAAGSTFKLSGLPSASLPLDMYVEAEALGWGAAAMLLKTEAIAQLPQLLRPE